MEAAVGNLYLVFHGRGYNVRAMDAGTADPSCDGARRMHVPLSDEGRWPGPLTPSGSGHPRQRDRQARATEHDQRDEVVDVPEPVACPHAELYLVVHCLDAGI